MCAPVAQWIERLPSKQGVVGSNPTWGTISPFLSRALHQGDYYYNDGSATQWTA